MKSVRIRTLTNDDTQALLIFEQANREWFENHIDARDAAFYCEEGVASHIAGYLADFDAGTRHPFVIEDPSGTIVGRANLKAISLSERSAQIGYRIAQSACGKGLATRAVRHLIEQAELRWELTHLVADVYAANAASAKVLERCGFSIDHISRHEGVDVEYRFGLRIGGGPASQASQADAATGGRL